ncbi:MAG TPA: Ig-like domain-containing protein, partial [Kribbellaceae bacterium]|nr:Ig-like domain-containing protein [Kribbellaceae bacterium]
YAALGGAKAGDLVAPVADHNGMPAHATTLAGSATGTIGAAGDVDWYVMNSGSPRSIRITVTPAANDDNRAQNFDPVLTPYDGALNRMVPHDYDVDSGGPGDPETFTIAVPAGLSYVAVRNFNGAADFRSYTVSATTATGGSPTTYPQLWVRDISPEDFAVTHTLAVKPVVTFQRDIDPASVSTSTVRLLSGKTGAAVPGTVAYDAGTHRATFTPSANLADITPYRIVVGAVQDTLGDTNTVPVTTTFRPDLLPTAVTGFDATGWYSSATVHWTNPSLNDFSQVVVRRSTGGAPPATPFQGVGVYAGTGTSATATGLGWGATYIFRAWVKDRAGQYSPFAETKLGGSRTGLAVSTTSLTYGGSVTLTGKLLRADGTGPIAGAALKLFALQKGQSSWRLLRTATTDSSGTAKYVYKPSATNQFQWRWYSGSTYLIGSGSNIATVGVRPVVSAYVSRSSLPLGGTVTVSGGVNPYHVGQVVYLQHYTGGGRWANVASGKLSSKSTYVFTLKPSARGTYSYRVVKPADVDHLLAVSPTRSFTVS